MDQEILTLLTKINDKLDKQETILKEHSTILREHSTILKEHSTVLKEHSQILGAIEHAVQVGRAEQDKMAHDIVSIKGEILSLRKDLASVELITANNWADIAKLKAIR